MAKTIQGGDLVLQRADGPSNVGYPTQQTGVGELLQLDVAAGQVRLRPRTQCAEYLAVMLRLRRIIGPGISPRLTNAKMDQPLVVTAETYVAGPQ